MSPDDNKRARYQGQAFVTTELANAVRRNGMTDAQVEVYADGMIDGIAIFVRAHFSDRTAYELFQSAADSLSGKVAS